MNSLRILIAVRTWLTVSENTKSLIKGALRNVLSIAGYVSTFATFFPITGSIRPYLRSVGVILIIAGIFRGALTVLRQKDHQIRSVRDAREREIRVLRQEQHVELATRDKQIE